MTSSAQTPEPTDEQWEAAWRALFPNHPPDTRYAASVHQIADVESVARALAVAVTAERKKVEAHLASIAVEMEADQVEYGQTNGRYYARRIREVSR